VAALCAPLLGDACAVVLEPGAAPERAAVVPAVPPALAAHLPPAAGEVVLAPLVARGIRFGVLAAAALGPRRLGPRELRLARALADRVALAVDAARLLHAALGAQRDSEQARGLLDAFFAAAPAGLAFFDGDVRYLQVNDVLAEASGAPPGAHVGRRPSEVLGAFGQELEELLREVLASGPARPGPRPRRARRRRATAARTCASTPVRLADGPPAGVGVVATDVTARVEADRARGRLLDRAALMAEAAEALDADLDYERTLQAIAEIPTGRVATWAVGGRARHARRARGRGRRPPRSRPRRRGPGTGRAPAGPRRPRPAGGDDDVVCTRS
jgi:PAS domain-containing protein